MLRGVGEGGGVEGGGGRNLGVKAAVEGHLVAQAVRYRCRQIVHVHAAVVSMLVGTNG